MAGADYFVTTAGELEILPHDAVVIDNEDTAWQAWVGRDGKTAWVMAYHVRVYTMTSEELAEWGPLRLVFLPARERRLAAVA